MEIPEFEAWLRSVCFQKPTQEAYDLAKAAWEEATKQTESKELTPYPGPPYAPPRPPKHDPKG